MALSSQGLGFWGVLGAFRVLHQGLELTQICGFEVLRKVGRIQRL